MLVWQEYANWKNSRTNSLSKMLINSSATLALVRVEKTLIYTNSRFLTLMQLLFSFDKNMKVEKTLIRTLASHLSYNSCSRLIRTWKLRKLSHKLWLLSSHTTLVLVWLEHDGWANFERNSRFSTRTLPSKPEHKTTRVNWPRARVYFTSSSFLSRSSLSTLNSRSFAWWRSVLFWLCRCAAK